ELLPDRVDRLALRLKRWVQLRRTPKAQRKVAVVLYGYPPGIGATGTAALLNVPKSLYRLLEAMKAEGYDVGDLPEDPEELVREITAGDQAAETGQGVGDAAERHKGFEAVEVQQLAEWLPKESQEAVESKWGDGLAASGIRTMGSQLLLGGRRQKNV
ncbi:Magnesium-chelatase subunit H (Mg-protoporphyrin IX chelatase subunit H), partial [Durusdinium trenchii]